ncbi:hypothetical protein HNR53_000844 [Bacillus benzoevorans]|uniref:Uncharacterized protein n=1 Tax=Bacillus benzoevorans TaxID=1456 RepID=A0A7X0LTT8_9BACI|nr:hypothetical protein [Bacillus benzoevorans]
METESIRIKKATNQKRQFPFGAAFYSYLETGFVKAF